MGSPNLSPFNSGALNQLPSLSFPFSGSLFNSSILRNSAYVASSVHSEARNRRSSLDQAAREELAGTDVAGVEVIIIL